MRAFFVIMVLALGGLWAAAALHVPAQANHPTVLVIDGDTLLVDRHVVQLAGIDAPEWDQTCRHHDNDWSCGQSSAYALSKQIALNHNLDIDCVPAGARSGSPVRSCWLKNEDLSLTMIQQGHAVALPEAPQHFHFAESQARRASLGMWGSQFDFPDLWRIRNARRTDCAFKGVTDADGVRRYASPLMPGYDAVEAATTFCSDDAARAAGWHALGEALDLPGGGSGLD
ncbi:MAG: thermonuclease family protein [Rhodobacterales bacterium]|nr:thermonuclease family protein [Rhodobacterales bacterium]